ncbi:MAG: hypothetical protein ABL956_11040 [Hyphomonadaceae bacterium]
MAIACVAPATAQDTCNGHFTRSQGLGALVGDAYAAMKSKDPEEMSRLLPLLEAAFALSASEVKPEICDGNHINAYTRYQNSELNFLRLRSVDIEFPANLPILKAADDSLKVSLRYNVNDETTAVQRQIREAMAKPN